MNRLKDIFYPAVLFITVLILFYLLTVMTVQAQSGRNYEFVAPKSPQPDSDSDAIFARNDSLFVKFQDGREIFTGETQKDGNGYFSIFPERAYHIIDSIKAVVNSVQTDTLIYFQEAFVASRVGWVTDSIIWVPFDTTFKGNECHVHDWVYSESYNITVRIGDIGGMVYLKNPHDPSLGMLLVCIAGYHPRNLINDSAIPIHDEDEHCPYEVLEREKICRKCMRSVIEREQWFQHYVAPPKSEFQMLKEKQREK